MSTPRIVVNKSERAAIAKAHQLLTWIDNPDKETSSAVKALGSLLAKMEKADERAAPTAVGMSLQTAESVLRDYSWYAPFAGGNPAPMVRSLRDKDVDEAKLRAVANWLNRQPWVRGKTYTLQSLIWKWEDWLAQAMRAPSPAPSQPASIRAEVWSDD